MSMTADPIPNLPLRPPRSEVGVIGWLRQNLFSSITNTILTVLGALVIYKVVYALVDWAVIRAVWTGQDGSACRAEGTGACWPFVTAKLGQFMYGRYPDAERWRVNLSYLLALAGLVALLTPGVPGKKWAAMFTLLVFPVLAYWLLTGGILGLPIVQTQLWGGLLVTLVVASVGITASFPLGILLALGRRSNMPVIRMASVGFIEFVRGVPLITMLFMASVMLPLFMPPDINLDKLLRALIGVSLFSAAYLAEVIRGGLQSIPRGQFEAADALGLSYRNKMALIVLPQALKLVIPGIVNSFVALFKDTSLVLIIGLFDLLTMGKVALSDPPWQSFSTEVYVVLGLIYIAFCYAMSRYSRGLEQELNAAQPR